MRDSAFTFFLQTTALVGLGCLAPSLQAQSIPIGEASLRFEATGSALYLSNPYLQDDSQEDSLPIRKSWGFITNPSAHLELGDDGSNIELDAVAGVSIRRLDSLSELDAEDLYFSLSGAYRGDRSNWTLRASSKEFSLPEHQTRQGLTAPKGEINQLDLSSSYRYSQRSRLATGINYSDRSYENTGGFQFSDHESLAIPIRAYYKLTDALEIGAGARFRERKVQNSESRYKDTAWHLAAEGALTSKLKADIKVGLLDNRGAADTTLPAEDSLFLSASATWQSTTDTSLTLTGSSDTYSTGFGRSVRTENLTLGANWRLNENFFAQANAALSKEEYELGDRQDRIKTYSAGVSYKPDSQLILSLSLNYESNNSTRFGLDYDALTFNWTGGWRF